MLAGPASQGSSAPSRPRAVSPGRSSGGTEGTAARAWSPPRRERSRTMRAAAAGPWDGSGWTVSRASGWSAPPRRPARCRPIHSL